MTLCGAIWNYRGSQKRLIDGLWALTQLLKIPLMQETFVLVITLPAIASLLPSNWLLIFCVLPSSSLLWLQG